MMTGSVPESGMRVWVRSTRRDMSSDHAEVVNHNEIGVRVRLSTGRERFYPWGQIAFIEWGESK